MTSLVSRLIGSVAGAAGGVAATAAMSAVLAVSASRGWLGVPPPKKIIEKATSRMSEPATEAVATVSHVAYGTGAGTLYGFLRGRRRAPAVVDAAAGTVFGLALWAASYEGWVPAAGIMPPAHRDRPSRSATMIVAHLVYGAVLGVSTRRWRHGRRRRARMDPCPHPRLDRRSATPRCWSSSTRLRSSN